MRSQFQQQRQQEKKEQPRVDKKDYFLLYSTFDSRPFNWDNLACNSIQQLTQMCYTLGLPVSHKNNVKANLVDYLKKHLEKEANEKKSQDPLIRKVPAPFTGRTRLNETTYPTVSTDTAPKKKLKTSVTEKDVPDSLQDILFPGYHNIPTTEIKHDIGGTSLFAEENDNENPRMPYSEVTVDGRLFLFLEKHLRRFKKLSKTEGNSFFEKIFMYANIIVIILYLIFFLIFY